MTDYRDGKIHGWNGGECPVHPKDEVKVWLREDKAEDNGYGKGEEWVWKWHEDYNQSDIIAFKVVKKYVEPKTIWVNEYPGEFLAAHASKEEALESTSPSATRVAVKYQEIIED